VEVKGRHLPPRAEYVDGKWTKTIKVPTPHTCFAVAAAVTGEIRARLYRDMLRNPGAIVACHTDGLISREPLDLELGPELGQWGLDHVNDETVIIGCGMYLTRNGGVWMERKRGLRLDQSLRKLRTLTSPVGTFRVMHANTLADAERTGWSRLNILETVQKKVRANMDSKRVWPEDWASFRDVFSTCMDSVPWVTFTPDVLRGARAKRKGRKRGEKAKGK
jgi:hypothetical protein